MQHQILQVWATLDCPIHLWSTLCKIKIFDLYLLEQILHYWVVQILGSISDDHFKQLEWNSNYLLPLGELLWSPLCSALQMVMRSPHHVKEILNVFLISIDMIFCDTFKRKQCNHFPKLFDILFSWLVEPHAGLTEPWLGKPSGWQGNIDFLE